jgi:glycine/D-amino acid oxidase-like deaminating enzyme
MIVPLQFIKPVSSEDSLQSYNMQPQSEIGQSQNPLLLSHDISASLEPLQAASSSSSHILVIGGGVTGLTTAWLLLDKGFRVTIISKDWASWNQNQRLTSQIAGALWELPPAGCGPQAVQAHLGRVQGWALESYEIYRELTANPTLAKAFGVRMAPCTSFHLNRIEDDRIKAEKMKLVTGANFPGFRHSLDLIEKYGVNQQAHGGLLDAYEHQAPIIDTDVAMAFLMTLVQRKGAKLCTQTVHGDLHDQENRLLRTYHADAIINATGLGGCETAKDPTVYPMRGALLRVINDGRDFPKVMNAMLISTESSGEHFADVAFIVPRNDNILLLGSLTQRDRPLLDLTVDSPEVQDMRRRCEHLLPALKYARLDPDYPIAQGLRPLREASVRVELETRTRGGERSRIVHSFGHGGAGWSLAFGTARKCLRLVEEVLLENKAVSVKL